MTDQERSEITGRTLLLYDGVCGLCNRTVRFLLEQDRAGALRFAPLQTELGSEMLKRFNIHTFPDGVIVITNALTPAARLFRRSDATAEALRHLPRPWPALGWLLSAVPRLLREPVYALIARTRYRIWGRYDACPLPTPLQRTRILGL